MYGITNAGGGGGLKATDALIRVQAPAGSTVTISKGTTTKTDLGHENADDHSVYDYYFIIHQSQFDGANPWTVTATLGSSTASSTIVINAADEYDVKLIYALYLIKNGIEQVTFDKYNINTVTNSGFVKYEVTSTTYVSHLKIGNINLTPYSTIELHIVAAGYSWNGGQTPGMGYSSSDPTFNNTSGAVSPYDAVIKLNNSTGSIGINTYTLDVSNAIGNKYIWIALAGSSQSSTKGSISISDFKLIPI